MTLFRILTGLLLLSFLAAVYYVSSGEKNQDSGSSLTVYQDPLYPNAIIFSWSGPIDPPFESELRQGFNEWGDRIERVRIHLDSPGGSVDEGEKVVSYINKMKHTHSVWTYVGPEADCLSMCVPIFLQGDMRVAAADSIWLFHDVSAVDPYTNAEIVLYAHERNQANFNFINRYIDRSDINPKWRERLKQNLKLGDVWKTGQELKDERSNIVTVLE